MVEKNGVGDVDHERCGNESEEIAGSESVATD
jgi:hypothetical protein